MSAFKPGVKRHHTQDDRANENIVGKTRDANQDNAVPHHAQNQHPDNRPDDGASTAGERGAADDNHRDHLQFVTGATIGVSRRDPNRAGDTCVGGNNRRQNEEQYLRLRDADSARPRRILITARGLNPIACFRLRQHITKDHREQDEPEKRRLDTKRTHGKLSDD